MRLLVFSDIHGDVNALERVLAIEADYYVSAGDLVSWARGLERVAPVLDRRREKMYLLPGNHESDRQIADLAAKYGFQDLHGRSFEADGHRIAGLGYSSPTPFDTPGEYSEEEMAERLKPFAGLKPLVLICHCPPLGTELDQIRPGLHAGSFAVRQFLEQQQPEYFFCGHIHEAAGVSLEFGRTKAFNVGKHGYLLET